MLKRVSAELFELTAEERMEACLDGGLEWRFVDGFPESWRIK